MNKRDIALAFLLAFVGSPSAAAETADGEERKSRIEGMLIGSLIGDAAGGPIEFKNPDEVRDWLPATRQWPSDRKLDRRAVESLAKQFRY